MKNNIWKRLLVILFILLGWVAPSQAATSVDGTKLDPVNYAFAAYIGNGYYKASDRNVEIINLPFSLPLLSNGPDQWGIRLRLPVSIGFYEFKTLHILETGHIPDVQTVTFLPGLEFPIPVLPNWKLTPFGDIGMAHDIAGGERVTVFGTGIDSLAIFHWQKYQFDLGTRLIYAGQAASGVGLARRFATVQNGLDVRLPWRFRVKEKYLTYVTVYYNNYYNFTRLQVLQPGQDPLQIIAQNEFGFTYGADEKLWVFSAPRIGLGYRFGHNIEVVRLVLGLPF